MAFDPARVKSLFLGASDLPSPKQRAAYLDREAGGEPELRARVEALLAAEGRAGPIPEAEVTGVLEPTRAEPTARPADFTPGRVVAGRYALLGVLGEGGMGTVYLAEQTRPVKRQVALKLIKLGLDSRGVLARFEAERQALAMMDHPNIARVYDGGTTEARQPYLVMEYVQGEPITAYCDRHRLPVEARLRLFVAACQAVQHAHQKGVIHRDLKPSNVMVTEVDGRPTPKVIDFGVAKATGISLTDRTLGDTGAIVGTPTYMSPEQADPSSMDIDTRTDVYALGVILYELLAGSPPLDATQFRRGALLEMLRMVREVDPSKPSTKVGSSDALPSIAANRGLDPGHLQRELRGDLDWIVMKALEKDRSRRYETANGFAVDILRHLASEPVQAAPPSRTYRLRKFARKHRVGVVAASLVVVALVAGIAGTTLGLFEAKRQEALANERAEGERKAKETVEAVLGFVEGKVFAAARPKDQDGGLGFDVKLADAIAAALPSIEADFRGKPLVEARLRMTIGQSFEYLGKPEIALEQNEAALALYRRELGPEHPDTLMGMHNLATSYRTLGRSEKALKLNEETLALRKAKLGTDHPDTLRSMNNLAYCYLCLGRYVDSLDLRKETLALQKAKLGPDHPDTLRTMNNLAYCYHCLGRRDEALELYLETLPLQKAKLGPEHPDTLRTMRGLAYCYYTLDQRDKALKLNEETLALRKAKLGPDHYDTLFSMNDMAYGYLAAGRRAEALDLLQSPIGNGSEQFLALAAVQVLFGEDEAYAATRRRFFAYAKGIGHRVVANQATMAGALRPSSDPADLEALLVLGRKAVEIGKGDWELLALGMAEFRNGHFTAADEVLSSAARAGQDDVVAGISAFYRAMSLSRQGKEDEAREVATRAAARMRMPTQDEQKPCFPRGSADLILWLAYKEAKALIGFDSPPVAPAKPDGP